MLTDAQVHATIPVVDMDRAKKFYTEKLGLKVMMENPGGVMFEAGAGTGLFLYQRGATKADHTVADFSVQDVRKTVEELRGKGVTFEEYDMPEMGIKTENGIAVMGDQLAAWFKDTEGNIFGISNMA
jgi:catechol 2,3-dioxygenase-like lactoylglutathione lyase family enzyme